MYSMYFLLLNLAASQKHIIINNDISLTDKSIKTDKPRVDWLIEQGLTSHQTHYRSYRGRFLQVMTKPTVSKHWPKPVGLADKVWIPPGPLHRATIIQLKATASMHGIRVPMWHTKSAGPVRTAHMSVLLTVNTVSHNPARSSSDNIPS